MKAHFDPAGAREEEGPPQSLRVGLLSGDRSFWRGTQQGRLACEVCALQRGPSVLCAQRRGGLAPSITELCFPAAARRCAARLCTRTTRAPVRSPGSAAGLSRAVELGGIFAHTSGPSGLLPMACLSPGTADSTSPPGVRWGHVRTREPGGMLCWEPELESQPYNTHCQFPQQKMRNHLNIDQQGNV